ncbi:MAG: membrane protein insertase YidC [Pseudohongiellaceae bacterium]|nr:membrane protein insertase YidC [Pseudohongiellaceae bacterium]
MDSLKYILFGGLAVVSYLLLLAWQEDYPRNADTQASIETPSAENSNTADIPALIPDAQTSSNSATASDIPSINVPAATVADDSDRLVQISTDVLNLTLDLRGGDIVGVSLPEYLKTIDVEDDPFVLLENTANHTYVAKTGLIGRNGIDSTARASYTADAQSYEMAANQNELEVSITHNTGDGITVIKRFHFERGNYLVDITYDVINNTNNNWQANIFGQINRNNFADPSSAGGIGMSSFLGFATTSSDDPYIKIEFDDIDDGVAPHETEGGWIALSQHYFLSAWIPPAQNTNNFSVRKSPQRPNEYIGSFTTQQLTVAPNSQGSQTIGFYAGPKDQYALREISENLDLTIDYGFLWFIASPIYWLLTQINNFVGNWGFSIILLTVCVKAVFYKLSATSYRSMAKMRQVMPKMTQLKERYGDDKMKLQKATMELYQKEKINPFGGCLPMLVQMPVFISLYWVLMESVELRHAPFIFYINDLSVMDPYFILPLIMGASMFGQQLLSPAPADPMQAKVMRFMPVIMTIFFLWFPAGLVVYWIANSVLGIAQQWYITRGIEKEFAEKNA